MSSSTTAEKPHPKPNGRKEAVAERVKAQVEEGVLQTHEALEEVASQATDELLRVGDHGVRFVRENPALAVVGAVGIGVLLGLALRKRS